MASKLSAFPPAPYYTLYGKVRDQVGQAITEGGAEIILLKGGLEIGRTPINSALQLDQNYELQIRIDQARSDTTLYNEKAVQAQGLFSLVVEMNGAKLYPIEVSGNLTTGKGSERVRLDLNLGEDLDNDGLPDTWEQWQLYQAGYSSDGNGIWPINLITKDGDFDHDGTSNYLEYIAGTFAGDASEKFSLEIKEKMATSVRFEFYSITGKVYNLETSTDMITWTRIPFSVGSFAAGDTAYLATNVGIVSTFTALVPSSTQAFYRLIVR
jgi:hypothetical protein